MVSSRVLITLLMALVLALSGTDAFAKLGKSNSFGSRSTRTYDRPMERSLTPPPVAPQTAPLVAPAYGQSPSFFQRNPFMSGFMGGMLGVGIGSMLFGHPAYASYDASPSGGIMGLIVQVLLVAGFLWLMFRIFRGVASGLQSTPLYQQQGAYNQSVRPNRIAKEFEPSEIDKQVFSQILIEAQRAWSHADIIALKQIATPEVVSFLSEDLSADASRGVRNVIEDVHLLRGDVVESWHEGNREFVTAALVFTAKDYTVRMDNGALVEGDPNRPVQSSEAWTFVRVGGGRWLLSAVER